MAASGDPVPCAAHRYSASGTPITRRTIVRVARRAAGYSPTAPCPGCSNRTGHAHWTRCESSLLPKHRVTLRLELRARLPFRPRGRLRDTIADLEEHPSIFDRA